MYSKYVQTKLSGNTLWVSEIHLTSAAARTHTHTDTHTHTAGAHHFIQVFDGSIDLSLSFIIVGVTEPLTCREVSVNKLGQ